MTNSLHDQHLDPDFIVTAYCNGYFPMAESRDGRISWYSPDPRAIIPLDTFIVSRSLRQTLGKKRFEVRIDTSFAEVIRACAQRPDTWISEEIIRVYSKLHERGYAHCVEAWQEGRLAGGLYGIAIRGAFFGESMFTVASNASKVALVFLVERLRRKGFKLLDTQFINDHVRQFGAREISRRQYLRILSDALLADVRFADESLPVIGK